MGLAAAQAFAAAGDAVALVDVNADAVTAVADQLTAAGHTALSLVCDVSDEDQVAASVARIVATFGRLDAAFNNAGIQIPYAGSADEQADDFDRVNAINYRGIWACMKHELRQMRTQGSGAIVNCSSIGGVFGGPGRAAYHGSKHAVIGLTKSAAKEYGCQGIRVNAVLPGTIETPMVTTMVATGALDADRKKVFRSALRQAEELAKAADIVSHAARPHPAVLRAEPVKPSACWISRQTSAFTFAILPRWSPAMRGIGRV